MAAVDKGPLVLKGQESTVYVLAFSPDGKLLASGGFDDTAMLWDTATGKSVAIFKDHSGSVYSLAFSPDGKILASGSADNTIILWDVASNNPLVTSTAHT